MSEEFKPDCFEAAILYCSTGCTCCREDNHYRGIYRDKAAAERRKARFLDGKDYPVCSQYAKYGRYEVKPVTVERIPGNRLIVENRVFDAKIIDVAEDGSLIEAFDDQLYDF